jgi:hypothetical protein
MQTVATTGAHAASGSFTRYYTRMGIGGSKMRERTPNPESEETPDSKPEARHAAAGSGAEQAKEQEREMEESGEENAA